MEPQDPESPSHAAPDGERAGAVGPRLPVLALRSQVLFPRAVVHVDVERLENLAALAHHPGEEARFLVVPVVDLEAETHVGGLSTTGTVARVVDRIRLPTGQRRVVLQGLWRASLADARLEADHFTAVALAGSSAGAEPGTLGAAPLRRRGRTPRVEACLQLLRELAERDHAVDESLPAMLAQNAGDLSRFADLVAANIEFPYRVQAHLLAEPDAERRLENLVRLLEAELARARTLGDVDVRLEERVRQRTLRQRLEAIQDELGEGDPRRRELEDLERATALAPLPNAARQRVERGLAQLRRADPVSPEAARLRAWLQWVLELPWMPHDGGGDGSSDADDERDEDGDGFENAAHVLADSHTARADVKQRVIEYLAVRRLRGGTQGTVLCFLGPPGTGKSSFARAVAAALGREFVQLSVGSLTEECELRGISAEFDGATPGLLLQAIARSGAANPVVLIDEIDKLQLGGGGTAAGPLLEILDPEQNAEFLDRYLGAPFDLSRCVFLATANDVEELSDALLDRLEVIEFDGYSEAEKRAIARNHLLPRAREKAGLADWQLRLTPAAITALIRSYTAEAGVRNLQRRLDALARKAAVEVVRRGRGLYVRKGSLLGLLGPASADDDLHPAAPKVGLAHGLAWTSAGGALLPVEAIAMPGSGRTILTGQLGDVLRESVQAAVSYVRTRFDVLGVPEDRFDHLDLHVHFPAAATPKDGPSAGIAIATCLVSLLTGVPVRHDVAMTGEMSLHGDVLPVGGVREKLLAALRGGMTEVVVPRRNGQDVLRLAPELRAKLTIHLIDRVDEAFVVCLAVERGAEPSRDGRQSGGESPGKSRGAGRDTPPPPPRGRRSARGAHPLPPPLAPPTV